MAQTHLADLFNDINVNFDQSGIPILDFSSVQNQIQSDLTNNYQGGKEELIDFVSSAQQIGLLTMDPTDFASFCNYFINQSEDLSLAVYSAGRNIISDPDNSFAINDPGAYVVTGSSNVVTPPGSGRVVAGMPIVPARYVITGDGGSDLLLGGSGNDILYAGSGDVIMDGGTGNAVMYGNLGENQYYWGSDSGDVTYLWGENSGNDTIVNAIDPTLAATENQSYDTIILGAGITENSITWIQDGNDLILQPQDGGKTLTIKNWFENQYYQVNSFQFADGTTITAGQVSSMVIQENLPKAAIPANIEGLPYLPGSGNVVDSWQAMASDPTGTLANLIQAFAAEDDPTVRSGILDQILYQWTGSETVNPQSDGAWVNAQQLSVLEAFYGQDFVGANGSSIPNPLPGAMLTAQYDQLKSYYDGWLMAQTHLSNLFNTITQSVDPISNQLVVNYSGVQTRNSE